MSLRCNNRISTKGLTLIETVVYIAIVSVLTTSAITSLLLLNKSLGEFTASRAIDNTAQVVMEKIVREVRFANSVNISESVLGINPGILILNTTTVADVPLVVEFSILTGTLELKRDGVLVGPLTRQNVTIDELIFDFITTPHSEAIKISLVLSSTRGIISLEKTFNTTTILRGSY